MLGDLSGALKLLRSIVNGNISGVKADAVMYATVIDALCKHGCVMLLPLTVIWLTRILNPLISSTHQ
jgi:hypothetical protein